MRIRLQTLFFLFLLELIPLYSQTFTIAVIPDTQGYIYYKNQKNKNDFFDFSDVYSRQIDYIVNNSVYNDGNIAFAIHVGDSVESRSAQVTEWEKAESIISKLDRIIPYSIVPGNHDYDKWITINGREKKSIQGLEYFKKYFGNDSIHFKNADWYIDSYNGGANSAQIFSFENIKFLHIGLEIEPDDTVLEWAQNQIEKNKNIPTIITTHEYLQIDYGKVPPENSPYLNSAWRGGFDRNSSKELWEKFISNNKQIFLVLCGHYFYNGDGEGFRADKNKDGYTVYSILQDYQGRNEIYDFIEEKNGIKYTGKRRGIGDGWLRLLKFDLQQNQIHIETYSTEFNQYENDANSDFVIKFDWDWDERFEVKPKNN